MIAGPLVPIAGEELVGQLRRAREHELRGRQAIVDDPRRVEEAGQDCADFVDAAPWQERHHRPRRVQPEPGQKRSARLWRVRHVEQRMAHPLDRHTCALVDLDLEGKDDQHAVGDALHRLHPSRPPRPQLRADVVHDRHAELAHRMGEPEIEVGEVDRDEHIGPGFRGVRQESAIDRVGPRQHARHLQQPGDRKALKVGDEARAGARGAARCRTR